MLEPLDFDRTLLGNEPVRMSKTMVRHEPEWVVPDPRFNYYGSRKGALEDKLFHLVARHIHRRYLKGRKRHLALYRLYRDDVKEHPAPPGVHPLVHAYWRWLSYLCAEVQQGVGATGVPYVWCSLGRKARMMTLWQYMQFTPTGHAHYLLGCYFDFVRLALGSGIASATAPSAALQSDEQSGADLPRSLRDFYAMFASERAFEPKFCAVDSRDSTREDGYPHLYFYVSRAVADEARAMSYGVRRSRRLDSTARAISPEMHRQFPFNDAWLEVTRSFNGKQGGARDA